MRKPFSTWSMAFVLLCAIVMSAAAVPARAQLAGTEKECGRDIHTPPSILNLGTESHRIRNAILCLINEERKAEVERKKAQGINIKLDPLSANTKLTRAADGHVQRAVSVQWWLESDPHIDPQLDFVPGTDPPVLMTRDQAIAARIKRAGYCPEGATFTREIAKDGAGTNATECPGTGAACSTPAFAVNWWMNISTGGHREAILEPRIREIGVGVRGDVANKNEEQNRQREKGAYVVNFGDCPTLESQQPQPEPTPETTPERLPQPRVSVHFKNIHVNNCPEGVDVPIIGGIGDICDWKLACGLNDQQQTEFLGMVEGRTGADLEVKGNLSKDGGVPLPVKVTCTVHEHDSEAPTFDVWELVGTNSFNVETPKSCETTPTKTCAIHINQNSDEGDVTVHFTLETIGSTPGALTVQPPPPPPPLAPTGCGFREFTGPHCGFIELRCNAPLPVADNIIIRGLDGILVRDFGADRERGVISATYLGEGERVLAVCAINKGGTSCGDRFFATFGPSFCPGPPPQPRLCPDGETRCPGHGTRCFRIGQCPFPK